MQWYVSQNGKTLGPFTEERVAMLVNWGKIANDAYICDDKWSCWVAVTRSHFAPLIAAYDAEQEQVSESPAPGALSEPPGPKGHWFGHRLALGLLIMLAAGAFLLALWLAPKMNTGPIGSARSASASVRSS
jgi:GYF domain 2